jgi:hypothetical protein
MAPTGKSEKKNQGPMPAKGIDGGVLQRLDDSSVHSFHEEARVIQQRLPLLFFEDVNDDGKNESVIVTQVRSRRPRQTKNGIHELGDQLILPGIEAQSNLDPSITQVGVDQGNDRTEERAHSGAAGPRNEDLTISRNPMLTLPAPPIRDLLPTSPCKQLLQAPPRVLFLPLPRVGTLLLSPTPPSPEPPTAAAHRFPAVTAPKSKRSTKAQSRATRVPSAGAKPRRVLQTEWASADEVLGDSDRKTLSALRRIRDERLRVGADADISYELPDNQIQIGPAEIEKLADLGCKKTAQRALLRLVAAGFLEKISRKMVVEGKPTIYRLIPMAEVEAGRLAKGLTHWMHAGNCGRKAVPTPEDDFPVATDESDDAF